MLMSAANQNAIEHRVSAVGSKERIIRCSPSPDQTAAVKPAPVNSLKRGSMVATGIPGAKDWSGNFAKIKSSSALKKSGGCDG